MFRFLSRRLLCAATALTFVTLTAAAGEIPLAPSSVTAPSSGTKYVLDAVPQLHGDGFFVTWFEYREPALYIFASDITRNGQTENPRGTVLYRIPSSTDYLFDWALRVENDHYVIRLLQTTWNAARHDYDYRTTLLTFDDQRHLVDQTIDVSSQSPGYWMPQNAKGESLALSTQEGEKHGLVHRRGRRRRHPTGLSHARLATNAILRPPERRQRKPTRESHHRHRGR